MHEKLPDICDQAEKLMSEQLEYQINKIKSEKPLQSTGFCLNCQDDIEEGLFCDKDCRDDYDFRLERGKVNGKTPKY